MIVFDKINQLAGSKLVVTDRLHGAIFALLAGKPVVVFDNNYGKISASLKNISTKYGDRILIAGDNGENVTLEKLKRMCGLGDANVRPAELLAESFDEFAQKIKEFIQ